MTALLIGTEQRLAIASLIDRAQAHPVDMKALMQSLETAEGKTAHMIQMSGQTITLPSAFMVTYSVELGHPAGRCRHMSMSLSQEGRVPSPVAVWMVAEEFGFSGGLSACTVWSEKLQGHGLAINVVQPFPS